MTIPSVYFTFKLPTLFLESKLRKGFCNINHVAIKKFALKKCISVTTYYDLETTFSVKITLIDLPDIRVAIHCSVMPKTLAV